MNTLPRFPDHVSIREVGPRDGLQNEEVILTTAQKVQLIDRLADTGLSLIEVGAFVRPASVPQMADTADVFAAISRRPGVVYSAIVPNAIGARRAVAAQADALQVFLSASESQIVAMSICRSSNRWRRLPTSRLSPVKQACVSRR